MPAPCAPDHVVGQDQGLDGAGNAGAGRGGQGMRGGGMRDLFDVEPKPRDGLPAVLAEVDCCDPWAAIWARMRSADGGFGRSGNAASQVVFGFGVEGRGSSADEAAREWVAGARMLAAGNS